LNVFAHDQVEAADSGLSHRTAQKVEKLPVPVNPAKAAECGAIALYDIGEQKSEKAN
jgi:hypothetical protein